MTTVHICQVANFYTPTSGGLRTAVDHLAAEYAARGHRCSLIVPDAHDGVGVDDITGRTILRVRAPLVPGLGGYRVITRRQMVRDALASLDPDVIELSDKTTLVGPASERRRHGTRVVLISHERLDAIVGRATRLPALAAPAVRRYDADLLRRVDAVVCASDYAASEFEGLSGPPLVRVPLGVDLGRFVPTAGGHDDVAGTAARPARIVSVVRLSPEKSPELLVDTARRLVELGVEYTWDVYGDGPLRSELIERAGRVPIHFRGHADDRDALAREMAGADVGVAPGRYETFGLAALEFLAAGTPVVVPDRGALSEIVPVDAGRRCPPDAVGFADGVIQLLACEPAALRQAARRHAKQHGWSATAERLLAVYEPGRAAA